MKKGRKKSIKAPIQEKKHDNPPADDGKQTASEADPNPFDFGGLPSRDLKKNLGCG